MHVSVNLKMAPFEPSHGSPVIINQRILSDGSLLFGMRLESSCAREEFKKCIKELKSFLQWVDSNNQVFQMVLQVNLESGINLEQILEINRCMKKRVDILIKYYKGTLVFIDSKPIEMLINTALTILPPLKEFHTIFTEYNGERDSWGLTESMSVQMEKILQGFSSPK